MSNKQKQEKMLFSKDFYEIMNSFEKTMKESTLRVGALGFQKEPKDLWSSKVYYCDGELNKMFILYLNGVMFGKIL